MSFWGKLVGRKKGPWHFDISSLDPRKRPSGISGYVRARNEGESLSQVIESHLPFLDELVIVSNNCQDNTHEIALDYQSRYPDRVKAFHYEPQVYLYGSEGYTRASASSPNSLTNLSNWALSKTTFNIVVKVDGDHVAIPQLMGPVAERIRRNGLDPILLLSRHQSLGSRWEGLRQRQPAVHHRRGPRIRARLEKDALRQTSAL